MVGADFDGNPVTIENNGKAKMIIFLAHWCPNCQDEVPEVTDWLEQNSLPDSVEIISVATSINRARDNFPPSNWLEREDWPVPVVLDSAGSEVGVAYGVGAFPLWAMVDSQGNLIARLTGAGQEKVGEIVHRLSSVRLSHVNPRRRRQPARSAPRHRAISPDVGTFARRQSTPTSRHRAGSRPPSHRARHG